MFSHFGQVVLCLVFIYYIFDQYFVPQFEKTGISDCHKHNSASVTALLQQAFGVTLPAFLVFLLAFFAILHSWLNAFAEMLRFADREFYKDWWNSRSFSNYYRTWNVVVHDWLYTYIYTDIM